MPNNFGLIDVDTPSSAFTVTSFADGAEWQLIFSDEFNTENRTFWPGDDPYWEAADLHYWQVRFPLPSSRMSLYPKLDQRPGVVLAGSGHNQGWCT